MKAIADTGFLVAFGNRHDAHHHWAVGIARSVTEPLLSCEAVLAETAFHLGSAHLVMRFVEEGLVRPGFQLNRYIGRLKELAARYEDRAPDLADLCLICLSELHPRLPVITTDVADFRVYRRGRREVIPLIHPPAL
jgi:predicted nucleic acid-binding protein